MWRSKGPIQPTSQWFAAGKLHSMDSSQNELNQKSAELITRRTSAEIQYNCPADEYETFKMSHDEK